MVIKFKSTVKRFIFPVFVYILVLFTMRNKLPSYLKECTLLYEVNTKNIVSNPHVYCINIKTALKSGHWRMRPGLNARDLKDREDQDIFLRRHRGLPDSFLRRDLRCGDKYPIDAPSFGPQLPSMCDRNSDKYCCNATNWCSSGTNNCACPTCTDFRKIVSAELYEWIPDDRNCRVRNYTSEKACSLVNKKLSNLVLIGDSLMRHFYAALMMIFTNDPLEGTMKKGLSDKERKKCQGERQFVDRGKAMCHTKLARSNRLVDVTKFCKETTEFYFHFNESYAIAYRQHAFHIVKKILDRPKSLIVVGIGMHDGLDAKRVMGQYVQPILKIIGKRKWPRLVWVTVHAQGYLKPMAYRGAQNNLNILTYNRQMTNLMEAKGIDVLDFYNMTLGVHSYDGTHYGYGINIAKAQFLLNYIDSTIDPL